MISGVIYCDAYASTMWISPHAVYFTYIILLLQKCMIFFLSYIQKNTNSTERIFR